MSLSEDIEGDRRGVCGHCLLEFKIIASSGLLRKHGTGSKTLKKQCPGSYSVPLDTNIERRTNPPLDSLTELPQQTPQIQPATLELTKLLSTGHQIGTIRFIPRAARPSCRNLLTSLMKAVLAEPFNETLWCELLKFPYIDLKQPQRGGHKYNLSRTIQKRSMEYILLSSQADENKHEKKSVSNANLASAVTRKIECGNIRAALRIICHDDGLAPNNIETLNSLRAIHPQRTNKPTTKLAQIEGSLEVSAGEISLQIKSFPKGSTSGPDLLSPQHLRDLISGPESCVEFLDTLANFTNLLLAGTCPPAIAELLCGAKLIALKKSTGKIRPIAVGCVYRRLAAKCANKVAMNALKTRFHPIQLGVGCKNGAEAAIHAARHIVSDLTDNSCLVKLDITNAFNSISRSKILESVHETLPEIYNFCNLCYNDPSCLWFNDQKVISCEGVQQGDPLGCTLFSLSIHPALEMMKSKFKLGYVDDVTLADDYAVVESDVSNFEQYMQSLGLELNYSKCEIVGNCRIEPNSCLAKFSKTELMDLQLLGAALFKGRGLDNILQRKIDELERIKGRIALISSHDALIILKNVLCLPKLNYLLRCSPCTGNPLLSSFDLLLRKTLSSAVNVQIDDLMWIQASLPVKVGGLGLRPTFDLAPSCFLASNHASEPLMHALTSKCTFPLPYFEAFDDWFSRHPILNYPNDPTMQSHWDRPCIMEKVEFLSSHVNSPSDAARLLAIQSPKSGSWLEAWPITSCGLRLSDDEVRIAVGLRLGAPLCAPHTCKLCGAPVDVNGTHGLSCRRSAGRHVRHSLLNDIVVRSLAKIHLPAMREPNLSIEDSSRVDGCTLLPWKNGKPIAWDVTVADTLAASHLAHTAVKAGTAADRAAYLKYEKYKNLPSTYEFTPIAFETLGPIHKDSLSFLKIIASKLATETADIRETSFFYQRISIAIQKGNAISILGSTNGSMHDNLLE